MKNRDEFRRVIETHRVEMLHDPDDTFVHVPLRAVVRDGSGVVEVGPYSITPGEAWLLAQSLLILARLVDPEFRQEHVVDPVEVGRHLRALGESGAT